MANKYESPIEEKMGAILQAINIPFETQVEIGYQNFPGYCRSSYRCTCKIEQPWDDENPRSDCDCEGDPPWKDNGCGWWVEAAYYALYRLDFAIEIGGHKINIECDGSDYHKRTQEQQTYDANRDKWLTGQGWIVKRYSGVLITRHPAAIKQDLKELIAKLSPEKQPIQPTLL